VLDSQNLKRLLVKKEIKNLKEICKQEGIDFYALAEVEEMDLPVTSIDQGTGNYIY